MKSGILFSGDHLHGRVLQLTLLVSALFLPMTLCARVDIDPRPVTLTLNWAGNDLIATQDFCVSSTQGAPPSDTTVIPYAVSATVPFALVNGAQQIPVSLSWIVLPGGASTPLTSGGTTGEIMPGAVANCPGGNNGRLRIFIANAAITAVTPGFYTQTFDITVSNAGAGRSSFTGDVTANLTLPDSIAVTQLDDILFPTYSGSNLIATESLCVFRASGGNYGVTLTGAGGAFLMRRTGLAPAPDSVFPYSVTWNDGTGAVPVTSGMRLDNRINGFSGSTTCNNGANNNATLGISVMASDIDALATESGSHSSTLTVMVEMQ